MTTKQPSPEDRINEKMMAEERASIERLLTKAKDELVEVTRQWAQGPVDGAKTSVDEHSERMSFLCGIIGWLENQRDDSEK